MIRRTCWWESLNGARKSRQRARNHDHAPDYRTGHSDSNRSRYQSRADPEGQMVAAGSRNGQGGSEWEMKPLAKMIIAACSLVLVQGAAADERGYYDEDGGFHPYSKSHPPPPEAPAPPPLSTVGHRSKNMRQDSDAEPPARFNHQPDHVVEQVQPLETIQKTCASRTVIFANGRGHYQGCAFVRAGVCRVFLADIPQIEHVRRHEYAHCNGWSPNHEP
jgi:hypothetical protein